LYALAEETGHQLLADYAKEFEETAAPMDTR